MNTTNTTFPVINGAFLLTNSKTQRYIKFVLAFPLLLIGIIYGAIATHKSMEYYAELPIGTFLIAALLILTSVAIIKTSRTTYLSGDGRKLFNQTQIFSYTFRSTQPLTVFSHVGLEKVISYDNDRKKATTTYHVILKNKHYDTELSSDNEIVTARNKAEQIAKHFSVPVYDNTHDELRIRQPDELDSVLAPELIDTPEPPDGSRLSVQKTEHGIDIFMPKQPLLTPFIIARVSGLVMFYIVTSVMVLKPPVPLELSLQFHGLILFFALLIYGRNIYPRTVRKKLSITKEGVYYKGSPYHKSTLIDLSSVEELILEKGRRLILISDDQQITIDVTGTDTDAEFLQRLIKWVIANTANTPVQE